MAPQSKNQRCYLLELPAELRLDIYELVYAEEHCVTVMVGETMVFHDLAETQSFSLLRTCKTINREGFRIFIESSKLQLCILDCKITNPWDAQSNLGRPENSLLLKEATDVHLQRKRTGDFNRGAYVARVGKVIEGLNYGRNVEKFEMNIYSLFPRAQTLGLSVWDVLFEIQCPGKVVCYIYDRKMYKRYGRAVAEFELTPWEFKYCEMQGPLQPPTASSLPPYACYESADEIDDSEDSE